MTIPSPERVNTSLIPKVLFVTPCAFNHLTGSGITFSNLFRGWPQDRIATIHRDRVPVSTDVCSRYYRLGWRELTPTMPCSSGVLNLGHLTRSLARWIEAFSPDVIYSTLGTLGYIDLVQAIQKRYRIPIVTHLMDEGVTDPQIRGWLSPWIRKRYGQKNRTLMSTAALRLGICEKMSATYSDRYGVPFETFMNTVDMERYPARKGVQSGKILRLVYTGSVLPFAQEQSLREVGEAVVRLCQKGIPIRLDVYTPLHIAGPSLQSMSHPDCVFLHEAIQDDATYFQTLQEADILVSPVNFDPTSVHFIRYSMPTKVPSYLCSGTPILVYGPENVAQVEYAEKDQWALIVKQRAPDLLMNAILQLRDDQPLRELLSQKAVAIARRNHDSAFVRDRFRTMLLKVAHG